MDTAMVTAITGSFQDMIEQLVTLVTGLLPIGLTLVGLGIGVAYAIKWIKKIGKG